MRGVWVCVWSALLCAGEGAEPWAAARAALAAGGRFRLQTTVLLNAAERRDGDAGYRLESELTAAPAPDPDPDPAPGPDHDLLCFTLSDVRVLGRGAGRNAEWEPREAAAAAAAAWRATGSWCARREAGALAALLLPAAAEPAARDYMRALSSLFQFQGPGPGGAERNETDSLGTCAVAYEALPGGGVRRVPRACAGDAELGAGGAGAARRGARLSLAAGALTALHAEEVLVLHAALKARSWHALERLGPAPPAARAPPGLSPHALPLEALGDPDDEDDDDDEDDETPADLGAALAQHAAALEGGGAGEGGSAAAARAGLRLLPRIERAGERELRAALGAAAGGARAGLCRALGLAGSEPAARAAAAFTRLRAEDALEPLAREYLAGLALAPRAAPAAVLAALDAAQHARRPALADAALLAAAAAARGEPERAAVRDAVTRGLARCAGAAPCRAVRWLALGNLRAPAADALTTAAERDAPVSAGAALDALRLVPDVAPAHLVRLGALVTNASLALELRAAALELVVSRRAASPHAAAPPQLAALAGALLAERGPAAHELRRLLWQQLAALAASPPVRALLPLLPRELLTWDAQAHAGTSHVLVRETGWGGGVGGWGARLESVQVAAGGLLRRGGVALVLRPPGGAERAPELRVDVWTRGLGALAGGDGGDAGEETAGGLALAVGGARLRDVTLFAGQAELLAHVWGGAGSAPTAVLRALRPEPRRRAARALLAGAVLRVRARAAAALALDAHAAVSLWHRTARGALSLRAALAADAAARVRGPGAELRARRELTLEPRLQIAFALDFYDGVALCVRASVPAHAAADAVRLRARAGARRWTVTRGARAERRLAGRTLALGRDNDRACRTLRANDDDE